MPDQNTDEALVITGGTVQGLIHENYGTVTQNFITQIAEGIADRGRPINSTKTRQQLRQRAVLLGKVKEYWIKGVLERSLNHEFSLDLAFENRTDLVERPFVESDCTSSASPEEEALAMSDAIQFYDQLGEGRTLLILGEPGAGKTMTLLKLADNLIKTAEKDSDALIPVIFNLSSWSSSSDLEVWLLEELQTKYGVSKGIGKELLANEELILMLDGLDEVRLKDRDACVIAMNKFLLKHGQTEMVVCCRLLEYQSLATHLQVREAILIHQLTDAQVARYLELAGDNLKSLRKLLQEDDQLREMASNPLMLSIMALAYSGHSIHDDKVSNTGASNRKQHLFDVYINRMLTQQLVGKPCSYKTPYRSRQVLRWFGWMAKVMRDQSQTIFLIENLQPYCLEDWKLRLAYVVLYAGLVSLLIVLALLLSLGFKAYFFLFVSLFIAFVISLAMITCVIRRSGLNSNSDSERLPSFRHKLFRKMGQAVSPFRELWAIFYSLYLQNLFDPEIIPIFAAKWSLRQALVFARCTILPSFLLCSLLFGCITLLISFPSISGSGISAVVFGISCVAFVFFVLIFLLPSFMLAGIKVSTSLKETLLPNQGIINSFQSIPLLAMIGGVSSIPFLLTVVLWWAYVCHEFLSYWHSGTISQYPRDAQVAAFWVVSFCRSWGVGRLTQQIFESVVGAGVSLAVFAASPCLKHLVLRLILACCGFSPLNYSRFLDYGVSRLFLRRVGGGYIFIHRDLLEHFAAM